MTQQTGDMPSLAKRLNQAADDLVSGATIFSDRVYGLLTEAADAIEALSPLGVGRDEVERAARAVHEARYGYEGQNPNSDPDDEDRCIARAALTSARAQ